MSNCAGPNYENKIRYIFSYNIDNCKIILYNVMYHSFKWYVTLKMTINGIVILFVLTAQL